jgi:hypothetical protein
MYLRPGLLVAHGRASVAFRKFRALSVSVVIPVPYTDIPTRTRRRRRWNHRVDMREDASRPLPPRRTGSAPPWHRAEAADVLTPVLTCSPLSTPVLTPVLRQLTGVSAKATSSATPSDVCLPLHAPLAALAPAAVAPCQCCHLLLPDDPGDSRAERQSIQQRWQQPTPAHSSGRA